MTQDQREAAEIFRKLLTLEDGAQIALIESEDQHGQTCNVICLVIVDALGVRILNPIARIILEKEKLTYKAPGPIALVQVDQDTGKPINNQLLPSVVAGQSAVPNPDKSGKGMN